MPRERKDAIIKRGTFLFARVRYTDDFGKTRSTERKADNRTHAKEILKNLLRELETSGEKGIEAEKLTFRNLAEDYKNRKLIPAEYHGSENNTRKIAGLRSWKPPLGWLKVLINHFGNKKI